MSAAAKLVYAVHGFLGNAQDWQAVKQKLSPDTEFVAENMFAPNSSLPGSFSEQTQKMTEKIEAHSSRDKRPKIFLGYSLGGRLGLHLLQHRPDLFDHYIFLSTNPGLAESALAERQQRGANDAAWAQKIQPDNWLQFLTEWNCQSVFAGSQDEPERKLSDYDPEKLRSALVKWSLGLQPDFSETIRREQSRIVWAVGEHDRKYVQVAQSLRERGIVRDYHVMSGGHRLWLDNPAAVAALIENI